MSSDARRAAIRNLSLFRKTALFVILLFVVSAVAETNPDATASRYFLFIGEPTAAAWKHLIENPQDRENEVKAAMAALGGKVRSYYFGLANGKNYITVELPDDNEVIQAIYLMRLPTGFLKSYEVIELMPSAAMAGALKRSSEFIKLEQSLGGGVE